MEQRDHDYARHLAKEGKDLVVFMIRQDSKCSQCAKALHDGSYLTIRQSQGLCMDCAGLADLVFLPSGDAAVTRRAGKYSSRKAVIVRWSKPGKRYERQGTLLEQAAILRAQQESAADAPLREAKNKKAAAKREIEDRQYLAAFTVELKRLFPSCPTAEAQEIVKHACEKYSGRVGRSADAKDLDPEKIRLAVIAHIRHIHTGYDKFMDMNIPKHEARRLIQAKIQRVLATWESASTVQS
jgi:hypothetical protein